MIKCKSLKMKGNCDTRTSLQVSLNLVRTNSLLTRLVVHYRMTPFQTKSLVNYLIACPIQLVHLFVTYISDQYRSNLSGHKLSWTERPGLIHQVLVIIMKHNRPISDNSVAHANGVFRFGCNVRNSAPLILHQFLPCGTNIETYMMDLPKSLKMFSMEEQVIQISQMKITVQLVVDHSWNSSII